MQRQLIRYIPKRRQYLVKQYYYIKEGKILLSYKAESSSLSLNFSDIYSAKVKADLAILYSRTK
jgi:hypothetical protein